MNVIRQKPSSAVIVGLGITGLSCARYLHAHGWKIAVTDSRAEPPGRAELAALDRSIQTSFGCLDAALLDGAVCVVTSPGVSLAEPFFQAARERGLPVYGDVELFALSVNSPVVAITGTNGKSTVTTLVGRMAERAGLRVRVGGNLGTPVLDLLQAAQQSPQATDLYVLELSSYQLETVSSLAPVAATVLNVTPDHLDRYASVAQYADAKARIFNRCDTAVVNLDDVLVAAMPHQAARIVTFSLHADAADYCLGGGGAEGRWLMRHGEQLMPLSDMKLKGLHNAANALAALALGEAAGLPMSAMLAELAEFPGLPHRSQWVADIDGVTYVDDSKGTNVGATLAAVAGLSGPLVVIAGGDGKAQDFKPLAAAFHGKVRHTVLIGRDAPAIEAALAGACSTERRESLPAAVRAAARAARPGDTVLLSPACASLDMFRNYAHRGEVFASAVRELAT